MKRTELKIARGLGWFSVGLGLTEVVAPGVVARFLGAENKALLRLYGLREIAAGVGILASHRPAPWMWARVAGDALDLAGLLRLAVSREANRGGVSFSTANVVAITVLDIWCALKLGRSAVKPEHIVKTITVGKPAHELYEFWRDPWRLAQIMDHVATVTPAGNRTTHWTLKNPAGPEVSWDAEFVEEKPGEMLRWRSGPDGAVESDGVVRFAPAPGDRGTEVTLNFRIQPGGAAGNVAANFLNVIPETLALHALRRFKALAETGEIPTIEHNSTARANAAANLI